MISVLYEIFSDQRFADASSVCYISAVQCYLLHLLRCLKLQYWVFFIANFKQSLQQFLLAILLILSDYGLLFGALLNCLETLLDDMYDIDRK